ncbi:MAG: hypothetical protein ACJAT2_000324 [Bacteriovoracaceae bacterium]|jgi:hypothetical protein
MKDKKTKSDRRTLEAKELRFDVPNDAKIYLLVDAQRSEAFSKTQIIEKIKNKDILITEYASLDGSNWYQLFQFNGFDRRLAHEEELPGLPGVNSFVASDHEVEERLTEDNDSFVEKEAMAGLAYIGHINSGKKAQYSDDKYKLKEQHNSELPAHPELEPVVFEKKTASKETYIWGAVLSFALIGIIYLFTTSPEQMASNENEVKEKKSVVKKVTKPARRIASKRPKPVAKKVINARKRTPSFTKSKAFQNRAPRKPARRIKKPVVEDPDDYYYDDGTDPVELDPIRSKISKETFDPEDDENLDDYMREDDAPREPASEFDSEEDPEKAFEALYE